MCHYLTKAKGKAFMEGASARPISHCVLFLTEFQNLAVWPSSPSLDAIIFARNARRRLPHQFVNRRNASQRASRRCSNGLVHFHRRGAIAFIERCFIFIYFFSDDGEVSVVRSRNRSQCRCYAASLAVAQIITHEAVHTPRYCLSVSFHTLTRLRRNCSLPHRLEMICSWDN